MTKEQKPSYLNFDKQGYQWKSDIDYRREPQKYRIGKGEQGVLICEPYKSELTPHWHFRTPDIARNSSSVLYSMFEDYSKAGDFVGADMARKFLQMGYTRARRYANYKGGIKYNKNNGYALNAKGTGDPSKAEIAAIFYEKWKQAESHPEYAIRKKTWREQYG